MAQMLRFYKANVAQQPAGVAPFAMLRKQER
jgi:hypothetical protein